MSTSELIKALEKSVLIVSLTHAKHGNERAEAMILRLQLLLKKYRPLTLHTEN